MKLWFTKGKAASEPSPAAETKKPEAQPTPAAQPAPQPAPTVKAPTPQPAPLQTPPKLPTQQPKAPSGANQRELYRNLMNSLYDAVMLVDEKGFVVDCNTRVEHTFGYSTGDMWDVPLQQLLKGFGMQVLRRIAEPLSEGRPVIINGTGLRKDGKSFNAEICVSKVKLTNAENLLFTVRDVTRRIIAEREKLRAQMNGGNPSKTGPIRLRCVNKKPAAPAS